jgi:hypothetical protein
MQVGEDRVGVGVADRRADADRVAKVLGGPQVGGVVHRDDRRQDAVLLGDPEADVGAAR